MPIDTPRLSSKERADYRETYQDAHYVSGLQVEEITGDALAMLDALDAAEALISELGEADRVLRLVAEDDTAHEAMCEIWEDALRSRRRCTCYLRPWIRLASPDPATPGLPPLPDGVLAFSLADIEPADLHHLVATAVGETGEPS